jgi:hypothetical protein
MTENGTISTTDILSPTRAVNVAASYNAVKEFEGRKYTGMRVGSSHSWYYRQGEWKETKVAPDKWQFTYTVNKRRKWDAPEGSGAPVGTEYHWYILAHQNVRKLDANEYTTSMTGTKYKLAHRRVASGEWSASGRVQLRQLITILEQNVIELRRELGEIPDERKETTCGQRIPLQRLPPVFMRGQLPLETYSMS